VKREFQDGAGRERPRNHGNRALLSLENLDSYQRLAQSAAMALERPPVSERAVEAHTSFMVYGPSKPGSGLAWREQRREGVLSAGTLTFQDDQGSVLNFSPMGSERLFASFIGRLSADASFDHLVCAGDH
jgi:hypothetical protein